jgi:hypothetical protein
MNENQQNNFIFQEDFTADEFSQEVDEFNLDEKQILGEEIAPDELDMTVSKDQVTLFTGSTEGGLNTADIEQLSEAMEVVNLPNENFIGEGEMEVKREMTEEEKEKQERGKQAIINGFEIMKEAFDDGVNTVLNTGLEAKKIREYKSKAVYPKSKFSKASESEKTPLKKYLFMACACVAAGIFGGVYANSYFVFLHGKVESSLNTAIGWIMIFDTLPVTMSPFDPASFFAGFGVWGGILAVIMLLSALNSDTMKRSKVGFEHGNAKLMNNTSFKKYKNRFMER